MEQYWIWLSSVDGIGPKRFYRLLSQYGDARGTSATASAAGRPQVSQAARTKHPPPARSSRSSK